MTVQELVEQFDQLSVDEQRQLFKILKQHISDIDADYARGLLATNQIALSDEEAKQAYIDYVDEKYH